MGLGRPSSSGRRFRKVPPASTSKPVQLPTAAETCSDLGWEMGTDFICQPPKDDDVVCRSTFSRLRSGNECKSAEEWAIDAATRPGADDGQAAGEEAGQEAGREAGQSAAEDWLADNVLREHRVRQVAERLAAGHGGRTATLYSRLRPVHHWIRAT